MKFLRFKDEFLRHTGLMFIGVSLFNLFNLLYHFFMVRFLSPADYGQLNTLMALFMVISVPASTVQTAVTKFVSSFQAQNQYGWVMRLLRHLLVLMSILGLFIFLVLTTGRSSVSSFLQISSYRLIILLGASLFFAMIIPIPWGGLQGLQKFGSMTLNLTVNGGLKFILGILFILLGWGVLGAMGAIAISYAATVFLSSIILRMALLEQRDLAEGKDDVNGSDPASISEVYSYFLPVGITLLCFMVLTNVDLILVKHYFTPTEAGYYSIAQMVGKIILFLPIPIVMVMFPKLSSLEGQGGKSLLILKKSLGMTLFFCCGAFLLTIFFPSLIIRVLSGKVYPECIPLLKLFSFNMSLFSLGLVFLYYLLSGRTRTFIYPLFFLTILQAFLIFLFHRTLTQVLIAVGVIGICLIGVNLYLVYYPRAAIGKVR